MGIAGDMMLSSLVDLMDEPEVYINKLNRIGIPTVTYQLEQKVKCGITGSHVRVLVNNEEESCVDSGCMVHKAESAHAHHHHSEHHHEEHHHEEHHHSHHHASMNEIEAIIDKLNLLDEIKEDAKKVYYMIAQAEGKVHGMPVSEIHFHEVGTMDAIADIVGCAYMLHELKPDKVIASAIATGYGHVTCAHGILPVPAPATALLLQGIPCFAGHIEGELCTPTGVALIKYFADDFQNRSCMRINRIGYGMGTKDFQAVNCVRAIFGEVQEEEEQCVELSCNIDDMTAEEIGYALNVLFEHGALDVYTTAIGMKKCRPGTMITVLCRVEDKEEMSRLMLQYTSTLGIRERKMNRITLPRQIREEKTSLGTVRIKVVEDGAFQKEKIEYEDLKLIADKEGLSLQSVRRKLEQEIGNKSPVDLPLH